MTAPVSLDEMERLADMKATNKRTIDLLRSLNPTFPEDIADRDRQLQTAEKFRDFLEIVSGVMLPSPPTSPEQPK